MTFNESVLVISNNVTADTSIVPFSDIEKLEETKSDRFSVTQMVRYYVNQQKAVWARTGDEEKIQEMDYANACRSYYLAIKEGCLNDDIIIDYLNMVKNYLTFLLLIGITPEYEYPMPNQRSTPSLLNFHV